MRPDLDGRYGPAAGLQQPAQRQVVPGRAVHDTVEQEPEQDVRPVAQEGLGIKIAIMRNGFLGMVRQWQELIHDKRYSEVQIKAPDFLKLADAYGIVGMRARKRSEVLDVIEEARSFSGPVLMDFVVEEEENVYPMVAPGKALDDMLRRPMNERIAAGY